MDCEPLDIWGALQRNEPLKRSKEALKGSPGAILQGILGCRRRGLLLWPHRLLVQGRGVARAGAKWNFLNEGPRTDTSACPSLGQNWLSV